MSDNVHRTTAKGLWDHCDGVDVAEGVAISAGVHDAQAVISQRQLSTRPNLLPVPGFTVLIERGYHNPIHVEIHTTRRRRRQIGQRDLPPIERYLCRFSRTNGVVQRVRIRPGDCFHGQPIAFVAQGWIGIVILPRGENYWRRYHRDCIDVGEPPTGMYNAQAMISRCQQIARPRFLPIPGFAMLVDRGHLDPIYVHIHDPRGRHRPGKSPY